ncbi:MAG TPA: hypothetical protein VN457_05850, partial [Chlamydiales bacterium]|nr:hypothetical protein [Chlamydiales bacterium]
ETRSKFLEEAFKQVPVLRPDQQTALFGSLEDILFSLQNSPDDWDKILCDVLNTQLKERSEHDTQLRPFESEY